MTSLRQQATLIEKMAADTDEQINEVAKKLNLAKRELAFQKQREDLAREIVNYAFFQRLQQSFFNTIFPIGGTIIRVCCELSNANLMTVAQRKELASIGNKISSVPYRILSGKIDVKEGFSEFVGGLKELGNFFKKNYDIALRIGATILQSLHPLGLFLKSAVDEVLQVEAPKDLKQGLMRGLGIMANHFGKIEKVLEQAADKKLALKPH